jgi:multidrug efflux pump subunit AcrB
MVYAELKEKLSPNHINTNYPNSQIKYGGEAEETNESFISLFKTLLLALLGIYFTLILLFNSLTQPLIVICTIPFSAIGIITAFALHNQDLGFMSLLGSIGLTGIVVNDALILVNHINNLRKENPDQPLVQLVSKGTADRFRALLLTTLTTVVGITPLAYGIGGSDPFIAPMGLA